MISSVTIKNFETWIDSSFELSPGVNIFTGESDKGKSGLIRALKWNSANRPQGDSYRNDTLKDPKESVLVSVTYAEGDKIDRERDGRASGVNNYRINDGEPLVALRTDLPIEVSEISRMKSVNIQGQHPTEQYFLLADKPGIVAKAFNKVAGLTIMDKALSDINSQVREANTEIKIYKKEIETREEQLEKLDWVEKAEKFVVKLKSLKGKINQNKIEEDKLLTLIENILVVSNKLKLFRDVPNALKEIKQLETEKKVLLQSQDKENKLFKVIGAMKTSDLKLSMITDTQKAINSLKLLEKEKVNLNSLIEKKGKLSNQVKMIKQIQESLEFATNDFENALKEFEKEKESSICPTCGRTGKN